MIFDGRVINTLWGKALGLLSHLIYSCLVLNFILILIFQIILLDKEIESRSPLFSLQRWLFFSLAGICTSTVIGSAVITP
jgi:hypothetical protein